MKKMNLKKLLCLTAAVLLLAGALVVPTGASSAYQTYTYSIGGTALYSPDAYTATKAVGASEMGLESLLPEDAAADSTLGKLNNPSDLVTDKAKNVYIADTGNNRILVLDRYYKLKRVINTFTNSEGVPDALAAPQGVFVSEPNKTYPERLIWVCDTANYRIVVFNEQGEFQRIIEEPESTLFDRSSVYKPIAIAVDEYNRLYVVSSTTYQGIIVMTDDGTFTGFIGAQVQSLSAWQIIWRRFQTKEQRENSEKVITTEFNNISINPSKNLVYATTSSIKDADVESSIRGGDKSGKYSPVKLLNANGTEIMRRNGFWIPAGEVDYSSKSTDDITGPSTIVDVAVGPEDTWSMIDSKRNRVYTYDFDGNLLFAFGDSGTQLGNRPVTELWIHAPLIAKKAKAGQFIIVRAKEDSERIPLTIAGFDREAGTVSIIFQVVGAGTMQLNSLKEGEAVHDFGGPLGKATEIEGLKNVCVVGGGVGCAIALPVAQALHEQGTKVTGIVGFRNKDLVILEDEFRACCDDFIIMTDDGSYGEKGVVTAPLEKKIVEGANFDEVITIGPLIMMKFVVKTTKPHNVKTVVSMNPIMVDGTGMCGGCRLTVGGQTKFACVDGPDFDGFEVDFDEAMHRGTMYKPFEAHAREAECNLLKQEVQ